MLFMNFGMYNNKAYRLEHYPLSITQLVTGGFIVGTVDRMGFIVICDIFWMGSIMFGNGCTQVEKGLSFNLYIWLYSVGNDLLVSDIWRLN